MKYKLIGLLAVFITIIASIFIPAAMSDSLTHFHQHKDTPPAEPCTLTHGENELCTHLPIVIIDTGGEEIPGKPMWQKTETGQMRMYYTKAENGESRIGAKMTVIDGAGVMHHVTDAPTLSSDIQIRVRGRSSREFAKSSYAIKLINEDNTNRDEVVLGMDAHHDWVLYGPYLDKTYLRNYMFYNIASELMAYSPNVRYCEVIVNGEYAGLYVMTESITAGKNGARLPLEVHKKQHAYTGYLLRLDRGIGIINDDYDKTIQTLTGYTYRHYSKLEIMYPGPSNMTEKIRQSINLDFSAFEKAIYSYDFDDDNYGYKKLIDVNSFVDALLITEITENYDFGALSTYIYKGIDERFRICLWDFNNSCNNFHTAYAIEGFNAVNIVWYLMLIKDEDFTERLIQRYRMIRKGVFSDEFLESYIDETVEFIAPAIKRDRVRWEETYEEGSGLLRDEERNPATFEEAVEQLKSFLHDRLAWMDDNIESIRQYSAESKVKKYSEVAH